jgi:hypothetical protein
MTRRSISCALSAAALAIVCACADEPSVLLHISRTDERMLDIYVCTADGLTCEDKIIFLDGAGPTGQSFAIYDKDGTSPLELNFQMSTTCERIEFDTSHGKIERNVALGDALQVTPACGSACTPRLPCMNRQ